MPTVGLALIARDEEKVLGRLLESCDGAFDEVVLVDTGSVDGTVASFERWASGQAATACRVVRFAWRDDFGAARQFADDQLTTDWRVWADCDDEIRGARELRRLAAEAAPGVACFMCSYNYAGAGSPQYLLARERMVRAGHGRWVGRIHETQELDGDSVSVDPGTVLWVHHGDGGADDHLGDAPRAKRDLAILDAEVREDPYNTRALFYLAQTHRDLGNVEQAIDCYERRAELGGWEEEAFYSLYQAGVLYGDDDDWPAAMTAFVDAWERRPTRIEPLHELAWRLRTRGQNNAALLFAHRGLGAPIPDDKLFVHRWVYVWGMLFEYSIAAYWAGDARDAFDACERLLTIQELPPSHREQTLKNRSFCRARVEKETGRRQPEMHRPRRAAPRWTIAPDGSRTPSIERGG